MNKGILTVAMISAAATTMLTGCSSRTGNYINYKNKSTSTSVAGSFKSYDGKIKETVKFDSDKTLKFTFDSDCTDGTITAVIVDKESDKTVCDFTSGNSTDFEAESGKKYEIIITLDDAKNGSYDLHWENK